MITKIKLFLQESHDEFKRVNWPSSKDTVRLTSIVIGFTLAVAAFLGLLDFLFSTALRQFIQ